MRAIRLAVAATLLAAPAAADDQSECLSGIEVIRAEVAKESPGPVQAKLRTALGVAERERGEQEWNECVDAVKDAKRALGR